MAKRVMMLALALAFALSSGSAIAATTPTPEPTKKAPLDLAALFISPDDVDEPGYGVAIGRYETIDDVAGYLNGLAGGTDADVAGVRDELKKAGWKQAYYGRIAIPSGDDPSKNGVSIYHELTEYADKDGAKAGYDLLRDGNASAGYLRARGGEKIGDASTWTRRAGTTSDSIDYQELDLVFQTGTIVIELDITDYYNEPPDLATLQAIADSMLTRIDAGAAGVGLGPKSLLLTGAGVHNAYGYYSRLDDKEIGDYGKTPAQVRATDRSNKDSGITDFYQQRQWIDASDGVDDDFVDTYLSIYRFAKDADAAAAVEAWSQNFIDNHSSPYTNVDVVADAETIGAASVVVSQNYDRGNDVIDAGYTAYVQNGKILLVYTASAVPGISLEGFTAIAKAATTCASRGGACKSIPFPEDLVG